MFLQTYIACIQKWPVKLILIYLCFITLNINLAFRSRDITVMCASTHQVWYLSPLKAPATFAPAAKDDGRCSSPPSLCSAWLIVSNCHISMTTSRHLSLQCCKIDNCVPKGDTIEKKRHITDTLAQHIAAQSRKSITEDVCERHLKASFERCGSIDSVCQKKIKKMLRTLDRCLSTCRLGLQTVFHPLHLPRVFDIWLGCSPGRQATS